MDEKKLMVFLQRILENNTSYKARNLLEQLKSILTEQKVPAKLIVYVDDTMNCLPDVISVAKEEIMSPDAIQTAKIRKEARLRREQEMRDSYRGCR